MNKTKLILIAIALVILSGLWLQSTAWFRLQLAEHYANTGQQKKAMEMYGRVLRKEKIKTENPLVFKGKLNKDKVIRKMKLFYFPKIREHFDKASYHYNRKEFRVALLEYDKVINYASNIYPFVRIDNLDSFGIGEEVIKSGKKDIILRIYTLAHSVDGSLTRLEGVNLLKNSDFLDENKNNLPDGYSISFYPKAQDKSFCNTAIIVSEKGYNAFHAWGKNGDSKLASDFRLGKIPPNTYFCFSIEIKENHIQGDTEVLLNTYTDVSKRDMAGLDSMRSLKKQGSKKGWQKKTFIIKTDNSDNIYFDRLSVGWNYGNKKGEVFIRKPKLEFGQNCSEWSSYLN
jgi:tetratricopeptide (TPR) repeat protein